jgi:hypothetical protein
LGVLRLGETERQKKEIIETVSKIKDAGTVEYLHAFIKLFLERWGK